MFAVSFAIIVVLRPPLFAENVVSKSPCLRFKAFMFAVRYSYGVETSEAPLNFSANLE